MPFQNIDAAVSAADLQSITDSFANIKQKLPFLVNLSNEERKSIVKTGSDSLTFVTKALSAAQANPTIFPGTLDGNAFNRDVELFRVLTDLATQAYQIYEQIDDTRMAVGGESMRQAMLVYDYVKTGSKTQPGLKAVADELGERFKKGGGTTPTPPTQA